MNEDRMTMLDMGAAALSAARSLLRNPRGWTTMRTILNECHLQTHQGPEILEFTIRLEEDRFGARRMMVPASRVLPPAAMDRLHGMVLARRWVKTGIMPT